jgi:hypothetical protein
MKHQRLLGLMMAAACAGPWACSGTDSRSLPRDGSGDTPDMAPAGDGGVGGDAGPQQAVCPDGTPVVHHSLTPRPSLPPLGALDLPGLLPATIIVSAKDGTSDSMRFDLCQGAGGLALHALLIRDDGAGVIRFVVDGTITSPTMGSVQIPEGPAFEVRVPRTAALVEGLQEAVGGNLRALRIRLLGDTGLLVVGHTDFLAVARGKVGVASIEYTSLYVLIGGLAPGNVFAGLRCSIVESSLTTSFRLDTAQFEVEACTGQGGGFTTAFRILRLTVQDSNPALEEAHRRRFELTTEAEVNSAMNYKWNHHNACDSFHLALGHADYAASAAPAAGCGPQVPNAPPRRFDEPANAPLMYRIRYRGGAWRDGNVPGCHHFLWCN